MDYAIRYAQIWEETQTTTPTMTVANSILENPFCIGKAEIKECVITGVLTCGTTSTITSSTIDAIYVLSSSKNKTGLDLFSYDVSQPIVATIHLYDTIVKKNIQFEAKGQVFLHGNSKVRGTVVNGRIISDSKL